MKTTLLIILSLIGLSVSANTGRYRLMFNTDPSTSITIAWEQESGSAPEVYYGTTDYGTTWSSYPNSNGVDRQTNYMGMDNRFSRLTGLSPNTVYYFVIKDSQGTSQRYWFRTCPDVNTETLSFISGGDSRSGQTQRQNSNRMVADIRPHAVLFGGDLVNTPGNASVQTWFDDWQLATTSDGQMIPIVHSVGNHEEYGTGGANFIYDLFDTSYDVYYNVRFGGDLFSMYTLNGEVLPGHTIANAGVRSSQTTWLQTTLSTDNSIWKAAQYHRPIVPHYSGKGEGSDEYTDWANKFYDYGVRLVMESDAHVVKMTDEVKPVYAGSPSGSSSNWFTSAGLDPNKGITFIGEGSWGTIRTPDDSHPMTTAMASFYSFNWILVDACKMEIRTIDTQSPGSVPEHVAGDYTSISAGLEAQVWKPGALPSGVRSIVRCNPPITDFTADQTNIFTGTTVNFTDLTANSPTSWSWDFGDGGNSTSQNPSYQYNTPGTYTVTLTATNVEGSDDEIKIDYIIVVNPTAPTADFVADMTTASVAQTIYFTDLSTGVPDTWLWDFGDGIGTSTAQNPSYAYGAPGTYTVTLTASNAYGSDDEIKVNYIVIVNGASVVVPVIAGNDDAEESRNGGGMGLTSSDLEIGNDGGDEQYTGVRFQNISVPQGAIISNAYIRMRGDESDGAGSQLNIYIKAEDIDNAPQFTNTNSNISDRTLTAAQYTWPDGSIPGWTAGTVYDTPDLSTVVQEIVDRPGWASGNAMVFVYWSDMGETSERVGDSYEGSWPAELHFDYIIPLAAPPTANFTAASTSTCEGTSIDFTDLSTDLPVTWSWKATGPEVLTSTNQNPTFNFTLPGTYNVELVATNTGGSDTHTENAYVIVNPLPTITASGTATVCRNESTSISASGASTYSWDNGLGAGSSHSVSPSSNTTYTVTGTDANGCVNSNQAVITVNQLPTVVANGAGSICDGENTSISASGASTYSWDNGLGAGLSHSVSPSASTTYAVTGTDANGCENTDQVLVTVNSLPSVSAVGVVTICDGENTSISASGASTYSWDNGLGAGSSHSVSPASTTTYTVIGTDANGCENTDQVLVTVNALPTVSAAGTVAICDGDNTSISASGASTYSWDNGLGAGSSHSVSPSSTTNYTVTGTDANGCENTDQVLVTVNTLPTVSAVGVATICDGDNTSISASGASTYSWDNGVGVGSSHSVSPSSTTTYTVTGTDANGCENTDQVLVTVNALPIVSAAGTVTICDGENTSISASGASTFSWDNGVGAGSSHSVAPSSTTTYTVTGTDVNGCVNTDQVMVTVNALPAITIGTVIDPNTCASATGSIEITGLNGGDITWNGPVNGNFAGATMPFTISGLSQGNYDISLVDANGCTSNLLNQGVNDPNPPAVPVISANGILTFCDGESVTLTSSYVTDNTWSTAESTQDIVVTTSGTFSVVYTDAQGCSSSSIPTVVVVNALPASPTITANGPITFCEGESVTLMSSEAIDNVWSTTEITNSIVVATSGLYDVTYTDGNGCVSISASTEVVVNPLPVVTVATLEDVCETADAFTLSQGTPAGGIYTGPGVNAGMFDPNVAGVGIHTITYSYQDANNCENTAQQTITVADCAGLEDLEKLGYKLYPNPADNEIFIERSEDSENALVKIYDANGKLVFDKVISDNPMKIDVSTWSTGVYQLHMTVGNVQVVDRVIVK